MHPEPDYREHRNLEPATADLYLFGTIRIPEKVARIIAFIGAIAIAFLAIHTVNSHTQPDPFVSGPGALSSSEKYIAFDGPAQRTYQPSEGTITYCDPDDHGRPTCTYGLLTPENREKGKNYQRHDVDFNPSGWPETNTYVTTRKKSTGMNTRVAIAATVNTPNTK